MYPRPRPLGYVLMFDVGKRFRRRSPLSEATIHAGRKTIEDDRSGFQAAIGSRERLSPLFQKMVPSAREHISPTAAFLPGAQIRPAASNLRMEANMYVVLGASGNTGHIVAKNLLARGQKVRVVGRNAARLQPLAAQGAEIFIGDVLDATILTQAFHKADAAYVMIPPNPTSNEYRAFQDRVSDAIAAAVRNAEVKNVVSLSSFGADKSSGTGPVVGLHNLEQKLDQIDGANVLHLRAGYFMENTLPQAGAIRMLGTAVGPVRANLRLPMIATRDIGAAAADALLHLAFRGKQTQELQGQRDLDYTEATTIIGKAIGKPDLGYIQAPDNQVRAAMVQMGMSENFAGQILELAAALNTGHMRALEPRSASNTTPTKFETFAAESFVPAYQQQAAA